MQRTSAYRLAISGVCVWILACFALMSQPLHPLQLLFIVIVPVLALAFWRLPSLITSARFEPEKSEMGKEEYMAAFLEAWKQRAMLRNGITEKEFDALIASRVTKGESLRERRRKRLSEKAGREVTLQEMFEEDRRRLPESTYPGPDCLEPYEVEQYAQTGALLYDRFLHVDKCSSCYAWAMTQRQAVQIKNRPSGPECFTGDELQWVQENGRPAPDRVAHAENCERCAVWFGINFQAYVDRVIPLPRRRARLF